MTIPRRVYTNNHMDVVAETTAEVYNQRDTMKGYRMICEAPVLRHFTARFEPLD